MVALLDQYGKPLEGTQVWKNRQAFLDVQQVQRQIQSTIRAKYDAAQTTTNNERHWENADNLSPDSANSYAVRKKLRARSRYEIIENNPYLKGSILTIANDFVGTSPKLQITDNRISQEDRLKIEELFSRWWDACGLRQKLWRMRTAKIVDGETFLFAYTNKNRKIAYRDVPLSLDFFMVETDQVSGPDNLNMVPQKVQQKYNELDGLRWNNYGEPVQYHLLNYHPGNNFMLPAQNWAGKWITPDYCIHWFRQDRGWHRGIPELSTSLPLCALLRRYTLAVVRAAEIAADFAAILETEGPPGTNPWTDGNGGSLSDDPFDTFPIEMGMFVTMPWGYKMKQLEAKQPMQMYDVFVNSILREILRPALIPFNLAAGTSKDSNMASGILDTHIYKGGQNHERTSCNETVLEHILALFFQEARLVSNYLPYKAKNLVAIKHQWRWDRIGLDHTDPARVAQAMKIAHDKGFLTDRDIQETYYNRDVSTWEKDFAEQNKFRESQDNTGMLDAVIPPVPTLAPGTSPQKKPAPKKKVTAMSDDDTVIV